MTAAHLLRRVRKYLLRRCIGMLPERRKRILAFHATAAAGVESIAFERDGLLWNIHECDDHIGFQLFVDGGFQIAEVRAVIAWMHRSHVLAGSRNVFVHVGANIGTTCIPLVRAAGCRALAIEPVQRNFSVLQRNVEANGLSAQILLARKAVSQRSGTVRMLLTRGASGDHFVAPEVPLDVPGEALAGHQDVEADTLAGIVAASGLRVAEVAFVWSDVQGSELDVIESGAPFWKRGVPLWVEVEPLLLKRQGALPIFATAAAAHFDRFIDARDLLPLGEKALPRPIQEFAAVVDGIRPGEFQTDVLLLPPAFVSR